MGIFSRMKRAAKSKANAVVERAISPEKELEMAVLELEEQHKKAAKELLAFKTSAKQMERDIETMTERAQSWEKKAMIAVKAGEDDLAKKCLAEKKAALIELEKIKRDRDEAAGYAIELNKSRKQMEARLRILKMKKGTMAAQIAAARSGTGNPFGHDDGALERLARAEERIDEEAIAAEVQAAMDGDELSERSDLEERLRRLPDAGEGAPGDDALAALKAKMKAAGDKKKLGSGDA